MGAILVISVTLLLALGIPFGWVQSLGLSEDRWQFSSVGVWLNLLFVFPHFLISLGLFYGIRMPKRRSWSAQQHWAFWGFPILYWAALFAFISMDQHEWVRNFHRVTTLVILWHFARQSFGLSLVHAKKEGLQVSPNLRRWVEATLVLLAVLHGVLQNAAGERVRYFGLAFNAFTLPEWCVLLTGVVLLLSALGLIWEAKRTLTCHGSVFPWRTCLTIGTNSAWMVLPFWVPLQSLWLWVPALHALEYLGFVRPVLSKSLGADSLSKKIGAVSAIGLGAVVLQWVPRFLDQSWPLMNGQVGISGWQFAVYTFFNLHHYFIDAGLWEGGEGDLKGLA